MGYFNKKIIVSILLIGVAIQALPVSAAAQPVQFKNDIFNPNWWMTTATNFVNDIFNRIRPAATKFVNDIFNSKWFAAQSARFTNDIFNSQWFKNQKSKFLNDIFQKINPDNAVNALKSVTNSVSAPAATSGAAVGSCFERFGTACYDSCGHTMECVKSCAAQFSICVKAANAK